ncbi:MAG: histidine kinase [Eubacterium sp.]|nr:histidine kinase [Eubacterium sp.]
MKEKENKKGIHHASPLRWQSMFVVAFACMFWMILCLGVFFWQSELMKAEENRQCEMIHRHLTSAENLCSEQVRSIYKDAELLRDFCSFWNHTIEGYMEKRLQQDNVQGSQESFPDYMNVFITENSEVFSKIYFLTAKDIYLLEAHQEGGGEYSYNIPYSQYVEECENMGSGYPIGIDVQDIQDVKKNVGRVVFLLDFTYLTDHFNEQYSSHVLFRHGNMEKVWGDLKKRELNSDFLSSFTTYTCSIHGNQIEIGMHITDVLSKNRLLFLILTVLVVFVAGLVLAWMQRMAVQNARFHETLIHTIQLAKQGKFRQVEDWSKKGNYAMLAGEINDMISKLDLLIKKEYLLKISQQKTQMQAMLYQINPHFLYNTLEIIRAQANIQGNVALSDALFDLGNMYRMLSKLGDVIPMRQEVALLKHYLNILELGNPENFYYEIDLDEETMELDTVKFWLQPLAENYFVHGYDRNREYNLFSVQGQKKEDGYQLLIMDNGSGMQEEELAELNEKLKQAQGLPKENIGIQNVCQRLKYFYCGQMTFQIIKNHPKGLCIKIFIREDWSGE